MEQIYLSRRNLLTLLSKLDRCQAGEVTACTVIKYSGSANPYEYNQTMDAVCVTAVEDAEFYRARPAGPMNELDEKKIVLEDFRESTSKEASALPPEVL